MRSWAANHRTCTRCRSVIRVGKRKVGRMVFPGGICYDCWRQTGGDKKKSVKKSAEP